jgi:drug/metabolite transporter (DMT)-like permease
MNSEQSRLLPTLALIVAALIWGSAFIAMKVAVMAMAPPLVIFWRMLLGSLLLAPLLLRPRGVNYRRGDWRWLALMALFEPGLYFLFECYALRLTSASQAGMVAATLPLMVAAGAWVFIGERPGARSWWGFALAVVGVVWLSLGGQASEHAPNPLLGNFLELLAMVSAVGYMLLLKRLSANYSPWFLTAVQALLGCLYFLPALLIFPLEPRAIPVEAVLAVVYLGSVVTIMAYGFYNYGMSRLPASQAGAFVNLIPVCAVALGWLLLGERLTPQQLLAAGLVLLGVLLSQERTPRPQVTVRKPARPWPPGS